MKLIKRREIARRKGQGLVEYAMLLGFVIAFIMAVRGFFSTNLSGMVTDQVNKLRTDVAANQGYTASRYAPITTSNQTSGYTAGQTGSGSETSNAVSNATQNTTTTY